MKTAEIVVIGAGPAGMTAALYAARTRRKVILIEGNQPGGQQNLSHQVDNFPGISSVGGFSLSSSMAEQVKSFGVEIIEEQVRSVEFSQLKNLLTLDFSGCISAKAVIIASGRVPRTLNVPGEDEFSGKGVSYCAMCDGAFFQDQDIVVVGGGNSALEEALFLTRYVKTLTLIHRRDTFRADKVVQEQVRAHSKIRILTNKQIVSINGKDRVESIAVANVLTHEKQTVVAQGVFVYVGNTPNTSLFSSIVKDDDGYIITDENMNTNLFGVFAAGDVRQKMLYQIVTACADGAIAAVQADKYLSLLEEGR